MGIAIVIAAAALAVGGGALMAQTSRVPAGAVILTSDGIQFRMKLAGGRYGFFANGRPVVGADRAAGVILAGSPVSFHLDRPCTAAECRLDGISAAGDAMRLAIRLAPHCAELIAEPRQEERELRFITGGAAPAYGLGDHAVLNQFSTLAHKEYDTDVSGFADDEFLSGQGIARLVSNFVIYPRQQFAEVLVDPTMKIVHTSAAQIVQGVVHAAGPVHLFYFFGNPHQIYAQFLAVRNATGYGVFMPKYRAFGVGWEAFGALGWNTNEKTVEESVDRYIAAGYPLRWVVIGSGLWPAAPENE